MSRLAAILTLLPCVVFAQNQYADIECISVDTTSTSKVTIRWQANAVSANQSYTIYKWDAKWNDIAVVNEASSENRLYTDVKAHPFERSERYAISTSIPGQQDSPLSAFHQTIFRQCWRLYSFWSERQTTIQKVRHNSRYNICRRWA